MYDVQKKPGSMDLYIELYIKGGAGSTYGYNNSGAAQDIASKTVNEGAHFMLSYMGPDQHYRYIKHGAGST